MMPIFQRNLSRFILVLLSLAVSSSLQAATDKGRRGYLRAGYELNAPDGFYVVARQAALSDGQNQQLDQWLIWLAQTPDLLGQSEFFNEPLVAGQRALVTQKVRLGQDLDQRMLVASHPNNLTQFQAADSGQVNHVRFEVSNSLVQFEVVMLPAPDGLSQPALQVTEGSLLAGDEITIIYENLLLPPRAISAFYLPVYFSVSQFDGYFQVNGDRLQVGAGPLERLELSAPPLIGENEPFDLKMVGVDKFGNVIQSGLPSLDLLIDGQYQGRIPSSFTPMAVQSGLRIQGAGPHHIEVRSGGGGTQGRARVQLTDFSRRIHWMDVMKPAAAPARPWLSGELPVLSSPSDETFWQPIVDSPKGVLIDWPINKGGGLTTVTGDWSPQTKSIFEQLEDASWAIAMAARPTDPRLISRNMRYVAVVDPASMHEWYANDLLQRGHRVSFVSSGFSQLPTINESSLPVTAVVTRGGVDAKTGLDRGNTYVTTGAPITIDMTLNNSLPGDRIPFTERREILATIKGTASINRVEVIKNGELLVARVPEVPTSDNPEVVSSPSTDIQRLKVTFSSDTQPLFGQRDLPRNGREWIGYVKATGVTFSRASAPGFTLPTRQAFARSSDQRVDFITWTRGKPSSLLLDLEIDQEVEDAVFEVHLAPGQEDQDVHPVTRPSALIGAARVAVPLFELIQGPVVRTIEVAGYQDEVRLELLPSDGPTEMTIRYIDISSRHGDYYYLKVYQQDDEVALTSPVFVGGSDAPLP